VCCVGLVETLPETELDFVGIRHDKDLVPA
jgi:hypothetical protein